MISEGYLNSENCCSVRKNGTNQVELTELGMSLANKDKMKKTNKRVYFLAGRLTNE